MVVTNMFQKLLSSCLLSKNLKMKRYKTIILCSFVWMQNSMPLTVSEEYKLKVF